MTQPRVGIDVTDRRQAGKTLEAIVRAERQGVPMAWSTVGRGIPDALPYLAAAAVQTTRIGLGSAIVPTYPRHPAVMATEALTLGQLAADRFRLGIGPSHRSKIEAEFGMEFGKPLDHLREYLQVLRPLLWEGKVDFQGEYYSVRFEINASAPVPIYISALRENAFRLAGELADGAISWITPLGFLRQRSAPAMRQAAEGAGRPTPRLVAHVPVVLTEDQRQMAEIARPVLSNYGRQPFYANMFADAGFPLDRAGQVTDELLDHLVVWGSDQAVHDRLSSALGDGIDEILVTLFPARDPEVEQSRLFDLLASLGHDGR